MLEIIPVPHALVPVDTAAAGQVSGPNYDEFQSDQEIWELIQSTPNSILRVTMSHCDAPTPADFLEEGSPESLDHALKNLDELTQSRLMRSVSNVLWVYEIEKESIGSRQIGLGGLTPTTGIRTVDNPKGRIIRNEEIRPKKAKGRADLIRHTRSMVGTVNLAVEDLSGQLEGMLKDHAASLAPDFEATDELGFRHRVWLVEGGATQEKFIAALAEEPAAFVADGNHRSAAAVQAGLPHFLTVFFVLKGLRIAPYNRLVSADLAFGELVTRLATSFEVTPRDSRDPYQPHETHHLGLYGEGRWYDLKPHPNTFDPANAAESIDADIVQRKIFADLLGMDDPRDDRINFVGGNKSAAYLAARVDSGEYRFALTLPPVTPAQFAEVCRQNRFMPPKSTWFEPKIRSGLVIGLELDETA